MRRSRSWDCFTNPEASIRRAAGIAVGKLAPQANFKQSLARSSGSI